MSDPTAIYIAGPMRGHDAFNFPVFFTAEEVLQGIWPKAKIVNPAREDVERYGLEHYLVQDPTGYSAGVALLDQFESEDSNIRTVMASDLQFVTLYADLVVALPGWEGSRGASAEVAAARSVGAKVLTLKDAQDDLYPDEVLLESEGELIIGPYGGRYKPCTCRQPWIDNINHHTRLPCEAYVPEDKWAEAEAAEAKVETQVITNGSNEPVREYEVRTTSESGGQKGAKAEKFYQIPAEPLALLAEHFGKGAKKYAAHNFRKGFPWSLCFDALQRHAWAAQRGEDYDVCPPDRKGCQEPYEADGTCYNHTGSLHMVAAMWQAMVLVEFYLHHKAYDDRFIYGRDGEEHNDTKEA